MPRPFVFECRCPPYPRAPSVSGWSSRPPSALNPARRPPGFPGPPARRAPGCRRHVPHSPTAILQLLQTFLLSQSLSFVPSLSTPVPGFLQCGAVAPTLNPLWHPVASRGRASRGGPSPDLLPPDSSNSNVPSRPTQPRPEPNSLLEDPPAERGKSRSHQGGAAQPRPPPDPPPRTSLAFPCSDPPSFHVAASPSSLHARAHRSPSVLGPGAPWNQPDPPLVPPSTRASTALASGFSPPLPPKPLPARARASIQIAPIFPPIGHSAAPPRRRNFLPGETGGPPDSRAVPSPPNRADERLPMGRPA